MLTKFTVAIILQFKYVSTITAFSDSEAGEIPARKRMSDLMVLLGCFFFFFSCTRSSLLHEGFLYLQRVGGHSLAAVHGLFIVVDPLVELGL